MDSVWAGVVWAGQRCAAIPRTGCFDYLVEKPLARAAWTMADTASVTRRSSVLVKRPSERGGSYASTSPLRLRPF